jgi:5-methylcytosine-specific restriction endonuclease McrA
MAYDQMVLRKIYNKTSGYCHICHKKLSFTNYGAIEGKGCWEVEHSHARAKGGQDHFNNLFPACVQCNRDKSTYTPKTARALHGEMTAPLSITGRIRAKRKKAIKGAIIGGAAGSLLGPLGVLAGATIGSNIAHKKNLDKRK